jgi:hypothetical protein
MWTVLHSVFRVAAVALGAAFVAMALLMYPGEEGRIQSVLEDIWNRLYKHQGVALSRHTVFMRETAKATSRGFDRLLGHELFSRRAFGVSICYSAASVGLVTLALNVSGGSDEVAVISGVCLLIFLLLGTLPALYPSFRYQSTWFYSVVGVLFFLLSYLLYTSDAGLEPLRISVALQVGLISALVILASFGSDILFIALTRRTLRWVAQMDQFPQIVAVILLNCLLAAGLLAVPIAWSLHRVVDSIFSGAQATQFVVPFFWDVFFVSASNAIDAIAASIFLLLAALMLIHRLFWPLLNRTLFRIKDVGIKGRRVFLVSVGLALLIAARELPDWFKEIIKALTGGA